MIRNKEIPSENVIVEDKAMNTVLNNNGGIDLNPAQMSMIVKEEGQDFKFDFNSTRIDAAQVTGATFTIHTMTPATNLPLILGLSQEPADKLNQPINHLVTSL